MNLMRKDCNNYQHYALKSFTHEVYSILQITYAYRFEVKYTKVPITKHENFYVQINDQTKIYKKQAKPSPTQIKAATFYALK